MKKENNLHQLVMIHGRDLFINNIHHDNPWVQDDPKYYVYFVEELSGWVKYKTCTGQVKYLRSDNFELVFQRPKDIYSKTLLAFISQKCSLIGLEDKVPNVYIGRPL